MRPAFSLNRDAQLRSSERILVWVALGVGALLRLAYPWDRAYIGDECGTVLHVQRSVAYLLTHFETWLTMNYFMVLEKGVAAVFGIHLYALTLVPILAGVATISLTAHLAAQLLSRRIGVIAAFLVALNPYLIKVSGTARSYSLLAFLSVLSVCLYFRWSTRRSLGNSFAFAFSCFLLMLSHTNGLYTAGFLGFLIAVDLLRNRKAEYWREVIVTLILPLVLAAGGVFLAYSQILSPMLAMGEAWHETPPTDIGFLPTTFSLYFVGSPYGWLTLLLLAAGILAVHLSHRRSWIFVPWLLTPVLMVSVQGLSHWYPAYARLLIAALPVLLMVLAAGIDRVAALVPTGSGRRVLVVMLVGLTVCSWIPRALEIVEGKEHFAHYKDEARVILHHRAPGDIVLSVDMESIHLAPYFSVEGFESVNVKEFLAGPDQVEAEARLVVVTSDLVESAYTNEVVRDARVIFYPLTSRRASIDLFLGDLHRAAVSNPGSRRVKSIYRQICKIDSGLGGGRDAGWCHLERERGLLDNTPAHRKSHSLF